MQSSADDKGIREAEMFAAMDLAAALVIQSPPVRIADDVTRWR
jgi:hypothetical protein